MRQDNVKRRVIKNVLSKAALYAVCGVFISACSSTEQPDLWQSEDVLRQAWQQKVDRDIEHISENQKELTEKFQALERLYISLSADLKSQQSVQAQATNAGGAASPQNSSNHSSVDVAKIEKSIAAVTAAIEQLKERVYSVELAAAKGGQSPSVETLDDQAETSDGSFVETDLPDVPILPKSEGGTVIYGIHLGSYRSRDQVPGAWNSLTQNFSELDQLSPKLYIQSQEGIGTFLRLIAGPYDTNEAATAACGRINDVEADQYCRVSEYQGEDL
jgi:hypothetical protein